MYTTTQPQTTTNFNHLNIHPSLLHTSTSTKPKPPKYTQLSKPKQKKSPSENHDHPNDTTTKPMHTNEPHTSHSPINSTPFSLHRSLKPPSLTQPNPTTHELQKYKVARRI